MNPLFPFRPLPADIEHVHSAGVHEKCQSARVVVKRSSIERDTRELTHVKPRLCNTRALLSHAQYVRLGWDLTLLPDPQGLVEETVEGWLVSLITAIQDME